MTTAVRAPSTTLILGGEIDIAVTPAIRQALMAAIGGGEVNLGVDASAVTFIDASGIGVLAGAAVRARAAGGDLLLLSPSPQVRRLLAIVHLDTRLMAAVLRGAFGQIRTDGLRLTEAAL